MTQTRSGHVQGEERPSLPAACAQSVAAGPGEASPLGRLASLEVRLARGEDEVAAAQALRYDVFHREMGAALTPLTHRLQRDMDDWDALCDHLVVVDHDVPGGRIVGTYRFLRCQVAAAAGSGFYSQAEFDVAALMRAHPRARFMELGRSCVLPQWRNKRTIELLWHGAWAYVLRHGIDVMVGCASLPGVDPRPLAAPLSFLAHHAAPERGWEIAATAPESFSTAMLEPGKYDLRRALHSLPPLVKGYLRLGARFASQAVIDRQFSTIDVFVILPVDKLNPRYVDYYGADAGRRAAGRLEPAA